MPAKKTNPTSTHTHDHSHDGHDHHDHDHSSHDHDHGHSHSHSHQHDMIADNTVLKLVIPAVTTKRAYQQALTKLAGQMKLPGFRPGKVPAKIAEEQLGFERVAQTALDQVLPAAYQRLIEKEKKSPLTNPDIKAVKVEPDQDWELEVQIAEKPVLDIKEYQKIVKKGQQNAAKAITDQEKNLAEAAKKDAKAGDKDNKADKKDATTLSDAQKEDLTLQEIYKSLITELKVAIPELLLRHETQQYLEDMARRLKSLNLSFEQYLASQNMSFEQLTSQVAAQSLSSLQLEFILDEVGQTAKLEPTEDQVKEEMKKRSESEHLDLDNPYLRSFIQRTLRRKLITEHLLSLK